jgi:hypothetical protein
MPSQDPKKLGPDTAHARLESAQGVVTPLESLERSVTRLTNLGTLESVRDNALLQLSLVGALRLSELASIDVSHISWDDQGVTIAVPLRDSFRQNDTFTLVVRYAPGICCPAMSLRRWLDVSAITSGPVFKEIDKSGRICAGPMSLESLTRVLDQAID